MAHIVHVAANVCAVQVVGAILDPPERAVRVECEADLVAEPVRPHAARVEVDGRRARLGQPFEGTAHL